MKKAKKVDFERHPLILGIRARVPHILESGAFDQLVLSVEDYRDTYAPRRVHVYGHYRPGRGPANAGVDFGALMELLAVDDLLPEIYMEPTWRESQIFYFYYLDLLLAWEEGEPREMATFHSILDL